MEHQKRRRQVSVESSSPPPVKKIKPDVSKSNVGPQDTTREEIIEALVTATVSSELTLWRKTSHYLKEGKFKLFSFVKLQVFQGGLLTLKVQHPHV
jgi:hypothetical protein